MIELSRLAAEWLIWTTERERDAEAMKLRGISELTSPAVLSCLSKHDHTHTWIQKQK
jgi:hypothetical protein